MPDPILRVFLTIQPSALNIDILILCIKIDITNRSRSVCELIGDANGFEERRTDKVHVLSWVGEEAYHAE